MVHPKGDTVKQKNTWNKARPQTVQNLVLGTWQAGDSAQITDDLEVKPAKLRTVNCNCDHIFPSKKKAASPKARLQLPSWSLFLVGAQLHFTPKSNKRWSTHWSTHLESWIFNRSWHKIDQSWILTLTPPRFHQFYAKICVDLFCTQAAKRWWPVVLPVLPSGGRCRHGPRCIAPSRCTGLSLKQKTLENQQRNIVKPKRCNYEILTCHHYVWRCAST